MGVDYYTLSDVYHAARNDREFNYCFWLQVIVSIIAEFLFLCVGRALVIVASVLITSIAASGFVIVLPVVATPWTLWFNFNILWGSFLVFSIIFNYVSAVITDPGQPAAEVEEELETGIHDGNVKRNSAHGPQCRKCSRPKPERTHHCSICKRCVLKMDHHCPWVNNCIGLNNYRYFYSFLFWTCLGTFYLAALLAPTVLREGSLLRMGDAQYEKVDHLELHKAIRNKPNLRGNQDKYKSDENLTKSRSVLGLSGIKREDYINPLPRKTLEQKEADTPPAAWNPFSYFVKAPEVTTVGDVTDSSKLEGALQQYAVIDNDLSRLQVSQAQILVVNSGLHSTSSMKIEDSGEMSKTNGTRSRNRRHLEQMRRPPARTSRRMLYVPTSFFTFIRQGTNEWNIQEQIRIFRKSELTLSLIFILSGAVSFAVGILLTLHTYLVLSAQTTLEFFLSFPLRSKFKKAGRKYLNPYDRGWRTNIRQVFGFGKSFLLLFLVPSWRSPPPAVHRTGRTNHLVSSSGSTQSRF